MCCNQGEQVTYEELIPPELRSLRGKVAQYVEGKIGQPAARYPGPIAAGADPLQSMAANIMMRMGGRRQWQPGRRLTLDSIFKWRPQNENVPDFGGHGGDPRGPVVPPTDDSGIVNPSPGMASGFGDLFGSQSLPFTPILPSSPGYIDPYAARRKQ
jgi:hypothetical protein